MVKILDEYWERIKRHFPEDDIPEGRAGRKPVPARKILDAVLWCKQDVLRQTLEGLANELTEQGKLAPSECYIDATFVNGRGGGLEVGKTKYGKGMKIMTIVERSGLPLSLSTHVVTIYKRVGSEPVHAL